MCQGAGTSSSGIGWPRSTGVLATLSALPLGDASAGRARMLAEVGTGGDLAVLGTGSDLAVLGTAVKQL